MQDAWTLRDEKADVKIKPTQGSLVNALNPALPHRQGTRYELIISLLFYHSSYESNYSKAACKQACIAASQRSSSNKAMNQCKRPASGDFRATVAP